MKSIKILTIVLIVLFAFSSVFTQEKAENDGNPVIKNEQNNAGAENAASDGKEKTVSPESTDKSIKKATEETAKSGSSVKPEKKKTANPVIQEEQAPAIEDNTSGENHLLSISEGNFKYKRIPDIKLPEKTPSMTEQNTQNIDNASAAENNTDASSDGGFFGFSKDTADIVAKGGILLLLLGIFILYRFRSKGSGRRGTSTRVMKSYRK